MGWRNRKLDIPKGRYPWPSSPEPFPPEKVIALYERGFAGTIYQPEEREALFDRQRWPDGEQAAYDFGLAGTGAGKLSLPYKFAYDHWPKCWPCPAQQTGDCFPAGTIIAGERIIPIEDAVIGDRVWNGNGLRTDIISVLKRWTPRPLVEVHLDGMLPLRCTGDHRLMVLRRAVRAELARNSSQEDCGGAVEWATAESLEPGDCLVTPRIVKSFRTPPHEFIRNDNASAYMIGCFLGNGYAGPRTLEFCTPKEHVASLWVRYWNTHGIIPAGRTRGKLHIFRIYSKYLSEWFRELFYIEDTKSFPSWLVGRGALVKGLLDTDGSTTTSGRCLFHSTSLSLIYGIYLSLVNLGYHPRIAKGSRGECAIRQNKPLYKVSWGGKQRSVERDSRYLYRTVQRTELLEGPWEVYDIGVSSPEHSFLANGVSVHNCVAHAGKNCGIVLIGVEVASGQPDPVTGVVEDWPEVSPEAEAQGVVACEPIYGDRGHSGQGASCARLIRHVTEWGGIMLRKPYPHLDLDLTRYTVQLGIRWGRTGTPEPVRAEGRKHQIRQATDCPTHEVCRDFVANGYPIWVCSGLGFSSQRDENGYSPRRGSWAHSWIIAGYDDREITRQRYGFPLALFIHDWGRWNSGGRRILGTSIDIPEGCMWIDARLLDRCDCTAMSNLNGWPRRMLPDWGVSDLI